MEWQHFKTWFEPIKPVALKEKVLTIQVPSQFFYEYLEEHYISLLAKTLKRELGKEARLRIQDNGGQQNSKTNRLQWMFPVMVLKLIQITKWIFPW